MCIAVIINKGAVVPSDSIFKRCFKKNPDGAGFAYCKKDEDGNDVVHYRKGFATLDHFLEAYHEDIIGDITHIVHFRKKSSGGMSMDFTHPFPITTNINELHKLEGDSDVGVLFHNGTIKTLEKNHLLSDSQELAIMLSKNSKLTKEEVGDSRVAVLFPDGKVSRLGIWVKEDFGSDLNPCIFSNEGYKTSI